MAFLSRLLGYRWSLYIVIDGNKLCYAVHENAVVRILGYVISRFHEYGDPVPPWSLHLNFNRNHTSFPLQRQHFSGDGQDLSPLLLQKLREIDPKYDQIRGAEPVVVEVATKKHIPISSATSMEDIMKRFSDRSLMDEITLSSILDEVFGVLDITDIDV